MGAVDNIIPTGYEFKHWGGNSPSHLKSSLFGTTLTILVRNGKLVLGEWQAIIFSEFDGPTKRKTIIELLPEEKTLY
jgi:secondary thiamine-phosphate synthase enzyme